MKKTNKLLKAFKDWENNPSDETRVELLRRSTNGVDNYKDKTSRLAHEALKHLAMALTKPQDEESLILWISQTVDYLHKIIQEQKE